MDISDQLAHDLLLSHAPFVVLDVALAAPGISQYTVTCKACAEHKVIIWRPGDPPVRCRFWERALEEKLVEDNPWDNYR